MGLPKPLFGQAVLNDGTHSGTLLVQGFGGSDSRIVKYS